MASSSDKEGPGIPTSGIIAVVLIVAGAIFVKQLPFIASRPETNEKFKYQFVQAQDVDARLWQDPFMAITQHIDEISQTTPYNPGAPFDSESPAHSAEYVESLISDYDSNDIIMPVMVFGGPYVEDAESRRRTRYAVVAALTASEFEPEDAQHIGYFHPRPESRQPRLPDFIPYEIFTDGRRRLLLLWLDEYAFEQPPQQGGPLTKINRLLQKIGVCQYPSAEAAGHRVILIGPANSSGLLAMLVEADLPKNPAANLQCINGLQIYSPAATTLFDEDKYRVESTVLKKVNIDFFRMIAHDTDLFPVLRAELHSRGLRRQPLAIVSELDTLYSRQLSDNASCKSTSKVTQTGFCGTKIYSFGYLRGLDGTVSTRTQSKQSAKGKKPELSPIQPQSTESIERAEGNSQFDYLRRLAANMKRTDDQLRASGEAGFKAIGILGNDLYDKLLVLQAIRNEFPQVLFFTTDLDARFLHPDEFKWTRNLIVVSSYGLELSNNLQGSAPPFRDVYQTATFLATKTAIANAAIDSYSVGAETLEQWRARKKEIFESGHTMMFLAQVSRETINQWIASPRVFEVGRTEFVDLSPPSQEKCPAACCPNLAGCTNVHPPNPFFVLPSWRSVGFGFAALLLVLALFWLGSSRVKRWVSTLVTTSKRYPRAAASTCAAILLLAGGAASLIYADGAAGEPFRLFEGVSIWPTEIIRFVAAICAFAFILKIQHDLHESNENLTKKFFPSLSRKGLAGPRFRDLLGRGSSKTWRRIFAGKAAQSESTERVDAEVIWIEHLYQDSPVARWTRIIVTSVLYFLFCCCVIVAFGLPQVPSRGPASGWIDWLLMIFLCVPSLIVLIFSVVDATRLCGKFADYLSRPEPTTWPPKTRARFGAGNGVNNHAIDSWIDVRMIAEWTSVIGPHIYFPFIVIFLMIVARNALFDNWDMPWGLLIVFAASLIYVGACVAVLRAGAEDTRQFAVKILTDELIKAKGIPEEASHADKLETILQEIRSLQEGAFAPISQQPFIRALVLPLSGASGIALIEYLFLGH
jgi:hypothetical protein